MLHREILASRSRARGCVVPGHVESAFLIQNGNIRFLVTFLAVGHLDGFMKL